MVTVKVAENETRATITAYLAAALGHAVVRDKVHISAYAVCDVCRG